MPRPTSGALRLARAVSLTIAVVGLAAGAHVSANGSLPPPLVIGALLGVTLCACAWATHRRLSGPAVLAVLTAGQWVLHQAFTALTGPRCGVAVSPAHPGEAALAGHRMPGHGVAAHSMSVAADTCDPGGLTAIAQQAVSAGQAPGLSLAMVLAHVAATLITAAVVTTGENALWLLLGWLSPVPTLPTHVATATVDRPAPRASRAPLTRRPRDVLLGVSPRRGPPATPAAPRARLATSG